MRFAWLPLLLFSLPAHADNLRMAMVTSLEASGLAAKLIAPLSQAANTKPHVIITGSGRALFLLARGDVDIIVTHDPKGEAALLDGGQASQRIMIMQNSFVLVGPADDPAQIASATGPQDALARIASAKALFISRGDLSGTHRKEQSLWHHPPHGAWYRSIGSGMAASIRMMAQLDGYGLVDEASYAQLGAPAGLRAFRFTDERMRNVYSVLLPTSPKPKAVRAAGWLQGEEAQQIISRFTIRQQQVYWPANGAAALPEQP